MHASPDNRVARWGIIGVRKITAELREPDADEIQLDLI